MATSIEQLIRMEMKVRQTYEGINSKKWILIQNLQWMAGKFKSDSRGQVGRRI